MDKIAVLIPCFNEEKTIGKVIRDWKKALPDAQIYVYDNNSNDQTATIAKKENAIVRYERKQGKGHVIRRMFREIDAECYILIDGDDTYSPSKAQEMADLVLNQNVDMVVGDRLSSTYYTENKRRFHNTGNNIVKNFINRIYKCDIKDVMTGCRALSYQFVKTFPVLSEGFEIETEMTIHAVDKNLEIENLVIEYQDRPEGSESKLNTFSDGCKVIRTIFNLFRYYKPFRFFSIISLILFVIALVLFIPIFIEYFETGLVPRVPTLIVSGFMVIAAIQTFFSGLVLDAFAQKNRRDFENSLINLAIRTPKSTNNIQDGDIE